MIKDHQQLRIPALSPHQPPLLIEVNWSGDLRNAEAHKDQSVRFKIGDKVTEVNFMQLWSLFFALSSPEQQTNMIPAQYTANRKIEVKFVLRADKDIKAGELIPVEHYVTLPEDRFIDIHDDSYKKAKIKLDKNILQTI